ncbi:MAG: hypothetical protein GEV06_27575 [Luteitalea sp.]|nr:hypothetical protein [Luteitalea sp.]
MGTGLIQSNDNFSIHAPVNLVFTAGVERFDTTGGNHFITSGSTYMKSSDVVQVVAAHCHVFAADIQLVAGGSSIKVTNGGIEISSSGRVSINGSPVKLNC